MKKHFAMAGLLLGSLLFVNTAGATNIETPNNATLESPEIVVMLPGVNNDNGFMEAGYRGYKSIAKDVTQNVKCVYNISATSNRGALTDALKEIVAHNPKLVIAHGGQCNAPVAEVSKDHPEIKFVVIQGNVKSANTSSYKVDQEKSAFLAGALAGYMTKTNKVGHLSGAWPRPGQQARAAFYDGLMKANPKAEFYSHFSGNLDSNEINAKAAEGEMEAGVDVIYTMLNGGRFGVNDAIAKTKGKVKEIGNVIDWTTVSPIFIGSAVADSSVAIYNAAKDYKAGVLEPNTIKVVGLENEEVVRLSMSKKVPKKIVKKIDALKADVLNGKVKVNTTYTGLEFDPATKQFVDQDAKNHRNKK
ncbi:MAG: BMP family protein [Phascolarctobacterium sp.]|nr:BMP family protein [Phascolarctobacterium sp.]